MSSLSSGAKVVPSDEGASRKTKRDGNGRDGEKSSKKQRRVILSSSEANVSALTKSAAKPTTATATQDMKSAATFAKKRKRPSPFRIKVGCVVALRHKQGTGNHVAMLIQPPTAGASSTKEQQSTIVEPERKALHSLAGNHAHVEVWTDPVPGRDEGLALIGRRVRCVFVRQIKAKDQQQQPTTKKYIVEGEVVSILEYPQWQSQRLGERQRRQGGGMAVELLVDQDLLTSVPFLERTDEAVDVTQLKKESAKRAFKNEERIRGKNKAVINVFLEDPSGLVPNTDDKNKTKGDLKAKSPKPPLVAKWAIRKRVPAKPGQPISPLDEVQGNLAKKRKNKNPDELSSTGAGADVEGSSSQATKKAKDGAKSSKSGATATVTTSEEKNGAAKQTATDDNDDSKKKEQRRKKNGKKAPAAAATKFLGDGNDDLAQQQQNWRWLAMRYHDLYVSTFPSSLATENPRLQSNNVFSAENSFDPYEYYSELLSSSGGVLVGEVLEVAPSSSLTSSTLAMVTIRRLLLPEHTSSSRLPHHNNSSRGAMAVFDDFDSSVPSETKLPDTEENGSADSWNQILFQIPIEELVIVSRRLSREYYLTQQIPDGEDHDTELYINTSYSMRKNVYVPLNYLNNKNADKKKGKPTVSPLSALEHCHRCRIALLPSNLTKCEMPGTCVLCSAAEGRERDMIISAVWWCTVCLKALGSAPASATTEKQSLPCCRGDCDCRECLTSSNMTRHISSFEALLRSQRENQSNEASSEDESKSQSAPQDCTSGSVAPFSDAVGLIKTMRRAADFDLPPGFIDLNLLPMSSGKQITSMTKAIATVRKKGRKTTGPNMKAAGEKKRKYDMTNRSKSPKKIKAKDGRTSRPQSPTLEGNVKPSRPARKMSEDYSVFKPTCSRLMDLDAMKASVARHAKEEDPRFSFENFARGDKPRNLREAMEKKSMVETGEKEEKKLSRRALRASQRRFMKDVTTLGASSLALDTLAGREQQLRFDPSGIHAWGVYTDVEISAEEMIVEYRGVLIGNAMAEKMQEQYERENIGSDYMFTIDDDCVCDATKEGNVARFINASCDPNCYTKIITSDGRPRIVIYAKRDIRVGEELSYDYKFALEYKPERRIPCHCGASECRGYLNWDKKFKEVTDEKKDAEPSGRERTRKHATKGLPDHPAA